MFTGSTSQHSNIEDYSAVDFSRPIYINPALGIKKMVALHRFAHRSYYTSLKVIFNIVKSIRSVDDFKRYIKALKAIMGLWVD